MPSLRGIVARRSGPVKGATRRYAMPLRGTLDRASALGSRSTYRGHPLTLEGRSVTRWTLRPIPRELNTASIVAPVLLPGADRAPRGRGRDRARERARSHPRSRAEIEGIPPISGTGTREARAIVARSEGCPHARRPQERNHEPAPARSARGAGAAQRLRFQEPRAASRALARRTPPRSLSCHRARRRNRDYGTAPPSALPMFDPSGEEDASAPAPCVSGGWPRLAV